MTNRPQPGLFDFDDEPVREAPRPSSRRRGPEPVFEAQRDNLDQLRAHVAAVLGHATVAPNRLVEKLPRRFLIALLREQKINGVAELVDSPVEVFPLAPHFDVGLVHAPAEPHRALAALDRIPADNEAQRHLRDLALFLVERAY